MFMIASPAGNMSVVVMARVSLFSSNLKFEILTVFWPETTDTFSISNSAEFRTISCNGFLIVTLIETSP